MKRETIITLEELEYLFKIDSSIPNGLRWKNIRSRARGISIGDPAGFYHSSKYYQTKVKGIAIKNHKIIYALHNKLELNDLPKCIDHIDRNRFNNSPENLRGCTRQQNSFNMSKHKDASSKYKGVSWYKKLNKWCSRIAINAKNKHLGYFDSEEEAHAAYCVAAKKLFGDFANLDLGY